MFVDPK